MLKVNEDMREQARMVATKPDEVSRILDEMRRIASGEKVLKMDVKPLRYLLLCEYMDECPPIPEGITAADMLEGKGFELVACPDWALGKNKWTETALKWGVLGLIPEEIAVLRKAALIGRLADQSLLAIRVVMRDTGLMAADRVAGMCYLLESWFDYGIVLASGVGIWRRAGIEPATGTGGAGGILPCTANSSPDQAGQGGAS